MTAPEIRNPRVAEVARASIYLPSIVTLEGVLPVATLTIPPEQYARAMAQLAVTFAPRSRVTHSVASPLSSPPG